MSRRRGRPRKDVRVRVHAQRREHIDFGALARAVLEQAAIDERARREHGDPEQPPAGTPAPEQTTDPPTTEGNADEVA